MPRVRQTTKEVCPGESKPITGFVSPASAPLNADGTDTVSAENMHFVLRGVHSQLVQTHPRTATHCAGQQQDSQEPMVRMGAPEEQGKRFIPLYIQKSGVDRNGRAFSALTVQDSELSSVRMELLLPNGTVPNPPAKPVSFVAVRVHVLPDGSKGLTMQYSNSNIQSFFTSKKGPKKKRVAVAVSGLVLSQLQTLSGAGLLPPLNDGLLLLLVQASELESPHKYHRLGVSFSSLAARQQVNGAPALPGPVLATASGLRGSAAGSATQIYEAVSRVFRLMFYASSSAKPTAQAHWLLRVPVPEGVDTSAMKKADPLIEAAASSSTAGPAKALHIFRTEEMFKSGSGEKNAEEEGAAKKKTLRVRVHDIRGTVMQSPSSSGGGQAAGMSTHAGENSPLLLQQLAKKVEKGAPPVLHKLPLVHVAGRVRMATTCTAYGTHLLFHQLETSVEPSEESRLVFTYPSSECLFGRERRQRGLLEVRAGDAPPGGAPPPVEAAQSVPTVRGHKRRRGSADGASNSLESTKTRRLGCSVSSRPFSPDNLLSAPSPADAAPSSGTVVPEYPTAASPRFVGPGVSSSLSTFGISLPASQHAQNAWYGTMLGLDSAYGLFVGETHDHFSDNETSLPNSSYSHSAARHPALAANDSGAEAEDLQEAPNESRRARQGSTTGGAAGGGAQHSTAAASSMELESETYGAPRRGAKG